MISKRIPIDVFGRTLGSDNHAKLMSQNLWILYFAMFIAAPCFYFRELKCWPALVFLPRGGTSLLVLLDGIKCDLWGITAAGIPQMDTETCRLLYIMLYCICPAILGVLDWVSPAQSGNTRIHNYQLEIVIEEVSPKYLLTPARPRSSEQEKENVWFLNHSSEETVGCESKQRDKMTPV